MVIAIPQYQDRISPLFDTCRQMVIVEVSGSEEVQEVGRIHFVTDYPAEKIRIMKENHIDLLICGAISDTLHRILEMDGIRVNPWTAGMVNDVLSAYRNNTLNRPCFRLPGRCRRGRGFRNGKKFIGGAKGGRK